MADRRRSERYLVSLPVWLKDAHGGERTTTIDVSAHGLALFSTVDRPLRQYVELEISLDSLPAQINVTAVVARHVEVSDGRADDRRAGLGLDFFLFDARAKRQWQVYLQSLVGRGLTGRSAPSRPASRAPSSGVSGAEGPPTFIIKPRDLGRLWAFYRGELSKGVVRIEAPVTKPRGLPVELLVVHPASNAEWVLRGAVARLEARGRTGRPVLEIALDGIDGEAKADFRAFVATGRGMVEEEVAIEPDSSSGVRPRRDSSPAIDPDGAADTKRGVVPTRPESNAPDQQETRLSGPPPPPLSTAARRSVFAPFFEEAAIGYQDDFDEDLDDTLEPSSDEPIPLVSSEPSDLPDDAVVPLVHGARPGGGEFGVNAGPRSVREQDGLLHRLISTEGPHPEMDREIALARARTVRSPKDVGACYRLATLLMQRGEPSELGEAERALQSALELEPNHPGAHHRWAELLARQGDYVRAAEHLSKARRLGYKVDSDLARIVEDAARGMERAPHPISPDIE